MKRIAIAGAVVAALAVPATAAAEPATSVAFCSNVPVGSEGPVECDFVTVPAGVPSGLWHLYTPYLWLADATCDVGPLPAGDARARICHFESQRACPSRASDVWLEQGAREVIVGLHQSDCPRWEE